MKKIILPLVTVAFLAACSDSNDDANFVMYTNHNETSNIKTRFYFDGNDIKYIKNIITTDEDVTEELLKITLNYNVDENVFKIPDDYAEVNY